MKKQFICCISLCLLLIGCATYKQIAFTELPLKQPLKSIYPNIDSLGYSNYWGNYRIGSLATKFIQYFKEYNLNSDIGQFIINEVNWQIDYPHKIITINDDLPPGISKKGSSSASRYELIETEITDGKSIFIEDICHKQGEFLIIQYYFLNGKLISKTKKQL